MGVAALPALPVSQQIRSCSTRKLLTFTRQRRLAASCYSCPPDSHLSACCGESWHARRPGGSRGRTGECSCAARVGEKCAFCVEIIIRSVAHPYPGCSQGPLPGRKKTTTDRLLHAGLLADYCLGHRTAVEQDRDSLAIVTAAAVLLVLAGSVTGSFRDGYGSATLRSCERAKVGAAPEAVRGAGGLGCAPCRGAGPGG